MGGIGPIANSQVTLYQAGQSTYRTGAVVLGSATADSNGRFTIKFTPPANPRLLYLVALGGNGGGGNNSAIGLMGVVGLSTAAPDSVTLTELTTVAGEWALAQFLDSTAQQAGAPLSNAAGIANAAAQASDNLADIVTGGPADHLPSTAQCASGVPPVNCDALERLDTLGNIIAACVQSAGPSATLPSCAAATNACDIVLACSGTPVAGTTLQAAHSIAANPLSNVSQLFAAQALAQPFAPSLSAAPEGFEIALNVAALVAGFNNPLSCETDLTGDIWIANAGGNTVIKLSPTGRFIGKFSPEGAKFDRPFDMAISLGNNVWVTNSAGTSVTELDSEGNLIGNHSPAGARINQPFGIELDSANNVWIGNFGNNSISELLASDDYASGLNFAPAGASLNGPVEVAIDGSGNVFTGNFNGNSVSELTASSGYTTGLNFAPAGAIFSAPKGLGLDAANNVWTTNFSSVNASELIASGGYTTGLSFSPAGAALSAPASLQLDSAGNVWMANFDGGTLSELLAGCTPETCNGQAFDPAGADLNSPYGIALDGSGNVWVTNSGNNSVSEFIGLAAPTSVPALCLKEGHSVSCLP
jgi:streptogramin lyase